MQWWCSAQTAAWAWTWRAYPGVWLIVLAAALAYGWLLRRHAGMSDDQPAARRWVGWAGILCLWVALDWPVGALGAGYLASVHMLQYLLIALLAPALILLGIPASVWTTRATGLLRGRAARVLFHPLVTLGVFNLVLYYTHIPTVVDGLMPTQLGSFAIDMLWFAAGILFWWPVLVPVPVRPGFSYPMKMGYLFLNTVLGTMPYAFLTFGELPFYGIYELSPPMGAFTARQDQQVAGLLMKVGGGVISWTAITIIFFSWYSAEENGQRTA
ncbi:MAG: cytochrome c oxidase assembly protein [Gemmatimonadota bacterium]